MSAITKAVLLVLIPAIYLANCAHSRNLKENREFEAFSKVKKSEMISRILPNMHHHLPRKLCGKRLVEAWEFVCKSPLANQQPSKRSSYIGSQLYSRYKRELIVDECCNQPCTLTDLLKYCNTGIAERPTETNRLHIHSTSRPTMNVPRRIVPLEVYEKNTERNLICIPQFRVGNDSGRVVDHLGNHWIRVNHSSVSDQMPNVKPEQTQNITLETTESETTQTTIEEMVESNETPEESAEPFGPESSEEEASFFFTRNYNFE